MVERCGPAGGLKVPPGPWSRRLSHAVGVALRDVRGGCDLRSHPPPVATCAAVTPKVSPLRRPTLWAPPNVVTVGKLCLHTERGAAS
jgi:hypothetical protein